MSDTRLERSPVSGKCNLVSGLFCLAAAAAAAKLFAPALLDWEVFAYLNITRPPIQVEMQVLDVTVVREQVRDVLLGGFFVDVRRDDDPSFDTADRDGVLGCARLRAGIGFLAVAR